MIQREWDAPTRQLADYAVGLKYEGIPRAAIRAIVQRLLDSVGCAFGAMDLNPARIARTISETVGDDSGASVIGSRNKTAPEYAAFSNTVMVRYLDFNDTGIGGHPSDMIPAILALAETQGASGRAVIKAIFAAYEVVAGLRRAGLYGDRLRSRHIDQVQSVLGSAAGAGSILNLTETEMANAISLAITPNVPLRVVRTGELSDWKGCATAHSSMMAVFAARLAGAGLTGPGRPFDGPAGLRDLIGIPPLDLSRLGQPLDGLAAVQATCLKPYPSEYSSQGPIESILALRAQIPLEDLERITIFLHRSGWQEIGGGQGDQAEKWDPKTRETADHSLAYLAAVALVDGAVTPDSFTAGRIADPALRPIMQKVRVLDSPDLTQQHAGELPKWPSRTEVILKRGKRIAHKIDTPKGHPLNPLTDRELEAKYMALCLRSIPEGVAQELMDTIMRLEELDDIAELTRFFRLAG